MQFKYVLFLQCLLISELLYAMQPEKLTVAQRLRKELTNNSYSRLREVIDAVGGEEQAQAIAENCAGEDDIVPTILELYASSAGIPDLVSPHNDPIIIPQEDKHVIIQCKDGEYPILVEDYNLLVQKTELLGGQVAFFGKNDNQPVELPLIKSKKLASFISLLRKTDLDDIEFEQRSLQEHSLSGLTAGLQLGYYCDINNVDLQAIKSAYEEKWAQCALELGRYFLANPSEEDKKNFLKAKDDFLELPVPARRELLNDMIKKFDIGRAFFKNISNPVVSNVEQYIKYIEANKTNVSLIASKHNNRIIRADEGGFVVTYRSDDEKYILTLTHGGTLKIYSADTAECLYSLRGMYPWIEAACLDASQERILVYQTGAAPVVETPIKDIFELFKFVNNNDLRIEDLLLVKTLLHKTPEQHIDWENPYVQLIRPKLPWCLKWKTSMRSPLAQNALNPTLMRAMPFASFGNLMNKLWGNGK